MAADKWMKNTNELSPPWHIILLVGIVGQRQEITNQSDLNNYISTCREGGMVALFADPKWTVEKKLMGSHCSRLIFPTIP